MNSRLPLVLSIWVVAMAAFAAPSFATHVVVRPDGTGDYPTLQAAVTAFTSGPPPADTAVIEPGYYDEVVNFPDELNGVLHGYKGAEATIVKSMTSLPERPRGVFGSGRIVGLQLETRINWGNNFGYVRWEDCIFAGGVTTSVKAPDTADMRKLIRCRFLAETTLARAVRDLLDASFEAPVIASNSGTYLVFQRCRFTGPAARLISVFPNSNSEIILEECRFVNAVDAIEIAPVRYNQQYVSIRRCVFDSLTGTALKYLYGNPDVPETGRFVIELKDSRISNVARAVHGKASQQIYWAIERDTITNVTSGPAIEATIRAGAIRDVRLANVLGGGMRLLNTNRTIGPEPTYPNTWSVLDSRVRHTGGHGIEILQNAGAPWDAQSIAVRHSVIESNGGDGLSFTGATPTVTGCLLRGNGGHGLRAIAGGDAPACSLALNTVVENHGHGVAVESAGTLSPLTLQHVLATHNGLDGLAVLADYTGSASMNDAWANGGAAYTGLHGGEPNLEVDPLYCMRSAGDFELRSDSPCAPSGIYGPIGALGVGCAVSTAVPLSAETTGLRIAPNPSRGPVAFTWGAGARVELLEVFDVQGRRKWSASGSSLHSGTLRWDGRGLDGRRLAPGVYLARWRAGGRPASARLVLLRD